MSSPNLDKLNGGATGGLEKMLPSNSSQKLPDAFSSELVCSEVNKNTEADSQVCNLSVCALICTCAWIYAYVRIYFTCTHDVEGTVEEAMCKSLPYCRSGFN